MTLLIPGETCWRTETADRVAVLVDTEAYFKALTAAFEAAPAASIVAASAKIANFMSTTP